jgi:uncharacterized protein YkwD
VSLRAVRGAVSRLFAAGLLAGAALTTVATFAPSTAVADSTYTMESQFVADMNDARQAAGLHPYAVASDLTTIAREHSAQMAQQQSLYHNPNLTTQVQNWQAVGENVGEGPTVSDIHDAFMHSPEHRANILDHDFTQVGVGVSVDSNGIIWVTEDFREPMRSTTTTTTTRTTTHHSTTTAAPHPVTRQVTHAAVTPPKPAPVAKPHVARPAAKPSPQAQLLAKLAAASAAPTTASADPVTQAFDYLSTVTSLTTPA